MNQYLTKEEIKQWRSSLEKITLEEYAKRLGKVLEEDKKTTDIIDIVLKNEKRLYTSRENTDNKKVVLNVAKKAVEQNDNGIDVESIKSKLKTIKPLTQREDAVLTHFIQKKGEIVYAKELALLLDLPSDYVYKYIKNLRTKISNNILKNATKGGYIFELN